MATVPHFLETNLGTQTVNDLAIAGLSILPIVYCGWNRLTAIPLICSLINAMASYLGWYDFTPNREGLTGLNTTSLFFNYCGYLFGEVYMLMYSYFILERLLPSGGGVYKRIMSRRTFLIVFWVLQGSHLCVRVSVLILAMVEYVKFGNASPTTPLYNLVLAQFILMATIESLTAYLLVRIFHVSRKTAVRFLGGRQVGLFKQMILSTEIRVASLAGLGILRAILEQPKRYIVAAGQVDTAAVMLMNFFPMLLVVDQLLTKAIKMEVDLQSRIEKCKCLETTGRVNLLPQVNMPKRPSFGTDEEASKSSMSLSARSS